MKRILQEFFQIPDDGDVPENAVRSRGIIVLVNVLVILGILSMTAYAFFGAYASSPVIPIKAASFQAELSLSVSDSLGTTQLISSQTEEQYTIALEAGKTYTLTLKPAGTAQTGFCILSATDCTQSYYTQQLGADAAVSGGRTETIAFTLIPTGNTILQLDTSWGTSALYGKVDKSDERYVFDGETVELMIAGMQQSAIQDTQNATEPTVTEPVTEPTTPPATEPAVTEPVTEPTTPPVTEPAVTEPVTEPTTPPVTEPAVTEPVTEPTTPPATEPAVTEPVTEPTTPPVTEPTVTEPATEPTTPLETEPVTQPTESAQPETTATDATVPETEPTTATE